MLPTINRPGRPTLNLPAAKVPKYQSKVPLSLEDMADLADWRRRLTRAEDAAKMNLKQGRTDAWDEFRLDMGEARADATRARGDLNGTLADSGFGDSPAFAARGLVRVAEGLEADRQRNITDRTDTIGALQDLYTKAHRDRTTGLADIERESARRRNYQGIIARIGGTN